MSVRTRGDGHRASLRERVEAPLRPHAWGRRGRALVIGLALVVAWGVFAWIVQLRRGLVATGMRDRVLWGVYVSNFVFFIGISYAGTLVSGILRLTHAEWRRPITRLAEMVTVVGLLVGGAMVIVDLGRPDRILNLLLHPQLHSPILWDVLSITTYLVGAIVYLWLPLIPDLGALRDRPVFGRSRRRLYGRLAMRWDDLPEQRAALGRGIAIMAVLLIPVAVSAHSVVSWIFGMTLRAGWNSSIFAPYFVVGAIYSGVAIIVLVTAIFRRVDRLEDVVTDDHFRKLGLLLLALGIAYAYLTFSDYLTAGYKLEGGESVLLRALLVGRYAPLFWTSVIGGTVIPVLLLSFRRTRTIPGVVSAAALVTVGMWLKRVVIVVPSLALPQMPHAWGVYRPTWVEWSITAGAIAAFALLFALLARLIPVISIWEVEEGRQQLDVGELAEAEPAADGSGVVPKVPSPARTKELR